MFVQTTYPYWGFSLVLVGVWVNHIPTVGEFQSVDVPGHNSVFGPCGFCVGRWFVNVQLD